MARKQPMAAETLEDIQGAADRLAEWIQKHLILVAVAVGAVLLAVAAVSLWISYRSGQEEEASTALATTRNAYLEAMGASPGALEVPELANREAAERIRSEYAGRFAEIAEAHPGTVSGALARLEVGEMKAASGDAAGALAIFEQAVAEAPASEALRGMLLQRSAQALEALERWAEAADRHEQAAGLADYPVRGWALADAARCAAQAGDRERALALYERVEADFPDVRLPDYQRAQLRELRAALH